MKKRIDLVAVVAGCLLLTAGPSGAEEKDLATEDRKSLKELMQRLDKDGDGRLTREEVQAGPAWVKDKFDQIDRDGDGTIAWDELVDHHAPWVAQKRTRKWMESLDKDGDGKLTRSEAEAGPDWIKEKFDRIDAAGEGTIEPEELKRHIESWLRSRYKEAGE